MRRISFPLALLALTGCATTSQPPLAPPGISREEKVTLGGLPETIFIRGQNAANPVLLFIHGGPGIPEMPFSHVNAALEKSFTVVQWDQRGTGKSYYSNIPPATMTVPEFVRETEELTRYLRSRFHQRKIYLVGFSFGSLVAILAASHHPEYYHAYIGISQLLDLEKSEVMLHRVGIENAEKRGRPQIAEKLRTIGGPPYKSRYEERLVNRLTKEVQPAQDVKLSRLDELIFFLQSPYYSVCDIPNLLRGIQFSGKLLEADLYSYTLETELRRLDLPVWFFLGREDNVLSAPLGAKYLGALRDQHGKHLVWFERSGHALQLEQPLSYQKELLSVLAATRSD